MTRHLLPENLQVLSETPSAVVEAIDKATRRAVRQFLRTRVS